MPALAAVAAAFRALPADLAGLASSRPMQLCFAAVTVIFAATGPFGTAARLGPGGLAAYWLAVMLLAWGIVLAHVALAARLAPRWGIGPFASGLLAALAATPTMTAAVVVFSWQTLGLPPTAERWLGGLLPNAVVNVCVAALALLADGAALPGAPPADPRASAPDGPPPLLARLPPAKRGRLLRLEMQDHYVTVVTDAGAQMLLMRMGDAVAECAPEAGALVHRSHWVARAALAPPDRGTRGRRGAGDRSLRTVDGAEIPVARGRRRALRDQGWPV